MEQSKSIDQHYVSHYFSDCTQIIQAKEKEEVTKYKGTQVPETQVAANKN